MIQFICLFMPAVLTLWLYEHLTKTNLKGKGWAYRYVLNVLLINGLCFGVKHYILHTGVYPLAQPPADMLPSAAINYLIMSIPLAVVLSLVQVFLHKHIQLTVEENKDVC